jgi:hypothetical protein
MTNTTTTTSPSTGDRPVINQPIEPRVGGLEPQFDYQGLPIRSIAWTGGGPTTATETDSPASSHAFRPDNDLKLKRSIETHAETGLVETKQIDISASNKVPFTTWLKAIKEHIEETGMDGIFHVLQLDGSAEYLLTDWGKTKTTHIMEWEKKILVDGITTNTSPCPYDKVNARLSAKFIKQSIGPTLFDRIDRELPSTASGPRVLLHCIAKLQATTSTAQRALVDRLIKLKLKDEPGKNVDTFANKVDEVCTRIDGLGNAPPDLPTLVVVSFLGSSVDEFNMKILEISNSLDDDPTKYSWDQVVLMATTKFATLKNTHRWPPLEAGQTQEQAFQSLVRDVRTLKSKIHPTGSAGGGGGTTPGTETRTCNYCKQVGHLIKDCPKKKATGSSNDSTPTVTKTGDGDAKKNWRRIPPSENGSQTKTVEGETYKWCGKCRRWNTGAKAHLTSEHKKRADVPTIPTTGTGGPQLGAARIEDSTGLAWGWVGVVKDPEKVNPRWEDMWTDYASSKDYLDWKADVEGWIRVPSKKTRKKPTAKCSDSPPPAEPPCTDEDWCKPCRKWSGHRDKHCRTIKDLAGPK